MTIGNNVCAVNHGGYARKPVPHIVPSIENQRFKNMFENITFQNSGISQALTDLKDMYSKDVGKTVNLFFANITSLSPQAKAYLFQSHMSFYHVLALCETHTFGHQLASVKTAFYPTHRHVSMNPARKIRSFESSNSNMEKGHGGEMLCWLKHIRMSPIDPAILQEIKNTTGNDFCFEAGILRIRSLSILIVIIYFHHGEGLSTRNYANISQIHYLVKILRLPLLLMGDFNMPPSTFASSGFLELWHAHILTTELVSTITTTNNSESHLDYVVHSKCLSDFLEIYPVLDVPWGPHYGFGVRLNARPRSMQALVQVTPKPLPLEAFQINWDTYNDFEKIKSF